MSELRGSIRGRMDGMAWTGFGRLGRVATPGPMAWLFASEAFASVVGFGVMIHLARRLGPSGFADFEFGAAVAAWALVLVRGGFDAIAYREAARRHALIGPFTDLLVGLRLASAVAGLLAVAAIALACSPDRGWVVAVSGLVLIPSAMACDVGLRASGRFGALALAQSSRGLGLAVGVWWLVSGSGHPAIAAGCVGGAEVISTLVLMAFHGRFWPKFRRRAWLLLARRGAAAGAARFGRVSLYAADILALGFWAGSGLGPYAAARRVAFALLALGLVVPTAVGPRIARAWVAGSDEAREVVGRAMTGLFAVALPATVGLMATADRWIPRLFGAEFREGGPWLALIAARLPFVLASNVHQATLIACRREAWALRLVAGMVILGVVSIPTLALMYGPWGVGIAALCVEIAGAVAGWRMLRRIDLAPAWHHASGPAAAGSLGLAGLCWVGKAWPLGVVVASGVCAYGLIWVVADGQGWKPRRPGPSGRVPSSRPPRSTVDASAGGRPS